jgi:hypothetical protein
MCLQMEYMIKIWLKIYKSKAIPVTGNRGPIGL